MARLIAWQVGGARGRAEKLGHRTDDAISDWIDDLHWMKQKLYEPWMCFRWPEVKVPRTCATSRRVAATVDDAPDALV